MKRALMIFLFPVILRAAVPDSTVESLVRRGIEETFTGRFESAHETFQQIIESHPEHPSGYFYRAAAYQSQMMDSESRQWESEFYQYIDSTLIRGHRLWEQSKDPWAAFYLGTAYSYRGLDEAKSGRILSGIHHARKGIAFLKESVEKAPWLHDVYIGIGTYMYWTGRFYKYFSWLPWIRDEREEGIRLIREHMDRSRFSYWAGVNSLAWIYYDRREYHKAFELFQQGLDRFPGSRFFLWGKADCRFSMEQYVEATSLFHQILKSILPQEDRNGFNEAVCRMRLLQCHLALADELSARKQHERLMSIRGNPESESRIRKIQRQADKIWKKRDQRP
ncbi:MAG TPA: tetratricopeptide repeat protein [bacterium]|nr:tetratricopeptide repeat protein [bacterium]